MRRTSGPAKIGRVIFLRPVPFLIYTVVVQQKETVQGAKLSHVKSRAAMDQLKSITALRIRCKKLISQSDRVALPVAGWDAASSSSGGAWSPTPPPRRSCPDPRAQSRSPWWRRSPSCGGAQNCSTQFDGVVNSLQIDLQGSAKEWPEEARNHAT